MYGLLHAMDALYGSPACHGCLTIYGWAMAMDALYGWVVGAWWALATATGVRERASISFFAATARLPVLRVHSPFLRMRVHTRRP